jgi:hypothetical protein
MAGFPQGFSSASSNGAALEVKGKYDRLSVMPDALSSIQA